MLAGLFAGVIGVAAALFYSDVPSEQALLAARWTARTAMPVFLVAYLASSLARLYPSRWTQALLRRRRQWGLGFAIAHSIHLAALLFNITQFRPRPLESLIAGGFAYLLIYIMALTSNSWSQRRLGRWWGKIHWLGAHYIWAIFAAGYGLRAINADPQYHLEGRLLLPVMLLALGLRLYTWRKGLRPDL